MLLYKYIRIVIIQEKKDYYLSRAEARAENQEGWFWNMFSYEPQKEIDHIKWSNNRVENRLKGTYKNENWW